LPTSVVRCSVIVAARDEEARLDATVRHLLAQRHVALDAIVVNDRSTDATGDILRRLSSEDIRVRSICVEHLPDGRLGKSHACHVGASVATGDWLLFTDADCWLKPDVIARALRVAAREAADHITLTPGVAAETLSAQAWHLALLGRLANWMSGVNRDRAGAHLGFGAFNLVRASAYRACGGYEALRLTIVDNIKLGLLLHRAGSRTRAFLGGADVECQWGTTVPRMIAIMEKNYFAAIDFRLAPVVAGATLVTLMFGTSIIGLWTRTAAGIAAGLAPWTLVLPAAIFARRLGWSPASATITPLLYPVLFFAVVNSALVTLRQGGVRWRDTFYSLDALRRGNVR
jgi:Glycosyl transferase family 2